MTVTVARTVDAYREAFKLEQSQEYPVMDALERRYGFAINRTQMEIAARVLACPVKVHPPNWQHGRLLYAVAMEYLSHQALSVPVSFLDIGTAKGFSALCLQWALNDAGTSGHVTSVDIINPQARVQRNTIAEVGSMKTLAETLIPWPEAQAIEFVCSTGIRWLHDRHERVHFAFVDGKHSGSVVQQEGQRLAELQQRGDVVVFDDVQLFEVDRALTCLDYLYTIERIQLLPHRSYAIGVHRG